MKRNILSIVAIILSVVAIIITALRVEVHITHETFIGIIGTFIGVIVTASIGYQLYNSFKERQVLEKSKTEIIEYKDDIDKIINEIQERLASIKKNDEHSRLEFYYLAKVIEKTIRKSKILKNDEKTYIEVLSDLEATLEEELEKTLENTDRVKKLKLGIGEFKRIIDKQIKDN